MKDIDCGHPVPDDEPCVRLVDEFGSQEICGLHAIGLLAQAGTGVEVTLMLTVPTAVPQ